MGGHGTRGGEVKAICFAKRRPNVPVEGFREMFLTAELDAVHALDGVRRYVQNHTLLRSYRKGEPAYDVVVEVVSSPEAVTTPSLLRRAVAVSPQVRDVLDRGRSFSVIVDDLVVKDGDVSDDALKCIALVHRPPGLARPAFFRHWAGAHGPLAARIPVLLRYVQHHARAPVTSPDGRLLEGCATTWFAGIGAMRSSARSRELAVVRADEPNFLDGEATEVLAAEHVLIDQPRPVA